MAEGPESVTLLREKSDRGAYCQTPEAPASATSDMVS
jgi:hypothetical protein